MMPKKAQTTIETEYIFSEDKDFEKKLESVFDLLFEKTYEQNRVSVEQSDKNPPLGALQYRPS